MSVMFWGPGNPGKPWILVDYIDNKCLENKEENTQNQLPYYVGMTIIIAL